MIMDPPTHIIDPDGEVIIMLRNSNSPLAELGEDLFVNEFSHTDDILIPAEEIELREPVEQSYMTVSNSSRKKKKGCKKERSSLSSATAHSTSEPTQLPTEEPVPELAPEPPTDEPVPEEPVPEEPVPGEPVPEEDIAEGPGETQNEEQTEIDLEEESCIRIQVSAKHLILASSVFKKILTGGWKESVTFLKERSVEITAEGWDIEALLILLRAIHGQQYHIPRKLTLEMLAKVAVLVDYYDCKESVYIWTTTWIEALEEKVPGTYCRDLFLWLWVSWAFQLPVQFKESTSTALSLSNGWINSLGLPIPAKIIGKGRRNGNRLVSDCSTEAMNKLRQENIDSVIRLLYDTRDQLLHAARGCSFECGSIMYGALTKEMLSAGLLSPRPAAPFPGWSYKILVQQVLSFRVPRWYLAYRSSEHVCPASSFRSLFGILNDTIRGLDLHDLT